MVCAKLSVLQQVGKFRKIEFPYLVAVLLDRMQYLCGLDRVTFHNLNIMVAANGYADRKALRRLP